MSKVTEYSNEIPMELKKIFRTAPRDNVDWALIMYLFRHTNPQYGCLFEEKNIVTVGKVAKYFNWEYDDVYKRLKRMLWWVNVNTVYGYYKPFNICTITSMGIKAVMKGIEIFEIER